MVVIISCCRRVSGNSGDIRTPNVAKAWYSASGMRVCDPTIPAPPSSVANIGLAYSLGYRARCASSACNNDSLASESGTVLIQVMVLGSILQRRSNGINLKTLLSREVALWLQVALQAQRERGVVIVSIAEKNTHDFAVA